MAQIATAQWQSYRVLLQDLPRTFPLNAWVASAEGQAALRHVLLAFSVHKPDVGYCQSMNYVAAMLLLCLDLSEERAFWVMVALIDDNGQHSSIMHSIAHARPHPAVQWPLVLLRTLMLLGLCLGIRTAPTKHLLICTQYAGSTGCDARLQSAHDRYSHACMWMLRSLLRLALQQACM